MNEVKFWFCFLSFWIYNNFVLTVPKLRTDIWREVNSEYEHDTKLLKNKFVHGDTSRLPRVLNFFPVPVEEECNANDGRRKGVCMNTYECKMKSGVSFGSCAYGFGVCCVFTATCDNEIFNNITYFVNPDFPDLTKGMSSCLLMVKKMDDDIAQIRLDFIHFNLGQPNRKNGVCEDDVFLLSTGNTARDVTLCGLNSGQHIYFDVENIQEHIKISMKLNRKAVNRLWEVKITQIPFSQRAPAGCLQYFEGSTGVVQTLNFAENGRHLANQDYNICIRQEEEMCGIVYEPCHENAFRISANNGNDDGDLGSGDFVDSSEGGQMETCEDKITVPCESDDLLSPGDEDLLQGTCDISHCGSSLCPAGERPCRIESTVTPFVIGVHFGPSLRDESPEDNLGMCLVYKQLPCNV
ncbi:uncharacterized protein LOC130891716 [Diorhabda carinulata]|uniref:uncharacterized protein LOC130891716 n=1 Tax=Diorhabda carinulata TaxID=1163345 RepID=UPI0025A26032|nr:uncharacterized protein LOC130891716 [Diorhabda carinulata]